MDGTHTHTKALMHLSSSMHNPGQRQKGKPCDSDLVMDQIDLIQCAGQFLILIPQDVSEWISCGRPIQLFSPPHESLRRRARENTGRQRNRETQRETET